MICLLTSHAEPCAPLMRHPCTPMYTPMCPPTHLSRPSCWAVRRGQVVVSATTTCPGPHPLSHLSPAGQGKKVSADKDFSRQKMVLGTHTSDGEQNYLMVAEVWGGRVGGRGETGD